MQTPRTSKYEPNDEVKLYTPITIGIATILGSFIAGSIFVYLNDKALKIEKRKGIILYAIGIVSIIILIVSYFRYFYENISLAPTIAVIQSCFAVILSHHWYSKFIFNPDGTKKASKSVILPVLIGLILAFIIDAPALIRLMLDNQQ
jgi:hypothetical protein